MIQHVNQKWRRGECALTFEGQRFTFHQEIAQDKSIEARVLR